MCLKARKPLRAELSAQGAVVAATKRKKSGSGKSGSKALLALTSAALGLPGMQAEAEIPVAEPQLNTQFGYYSEEGDRMSVQVYHGGFVAPVNDWLQLSFSVDEDTYVGASPAYVVPANSAEIVTKASGFDNAGGAAFGLMNDEIQTNAFADPTILAGIFSDIGNGFVLPVLPADVAQKVNKDPNDLGVRLQTEMIKRYLEKKQSGTDQTPTQVIEPHPLETRHMPVLGGKFFLGPYTLSVSGGYSLEPDYESTFASTYHSFEFNDKLTTLTLGYRLANNKIIREATASGGPHDHGWEQEDFEATNTFRTYSLGLSQILSKNTLFYLNGEYTRRRGYLSNPYKLVHIKGLLSAADYTLVGFYAPLDDSNKGWNYYTGVDLTPMGIDLYREVRPDKRDQWSISAGINQYFSGLNGALHANYRYQWDDWQIRSHTLDLAWYQNLPFGIMLKPHIRYYSQTAAEFYAPYFLAPRADGHYSSDYRLSAFGKFSGGLIVSKQFAKGVTLTGGFEYFTQRSSLGLDGDETSSFADIDSYLLTAALDVNLSSLGRGLADQHGQHKHHHHGGHAPAGIMYGHMLDNAGDLMISYNYGHSYWADGFQRSTQTGISDQELVDYACPGGICEFKAASMRMDMHMINFMYAPTDWLNLMVMPQFAYMKMDMAPLPSSTATEGGYHENVGLGDTIMSALVKVFDDGTHHVHFGIGVSAPTGRTDVTFDGFQNDTSQLQSYGMQLGSGTWDLKPSLTYTGNSGSWFWGGQLSGTKRLQSHNSEGYALGDEFAGSVWGGYRALDWLSFSVRNQYRIQGSIHGEAPRMLYQVDPDDDDTPQLTTNLSPGNYGGKFWDIGLGATLSVPSGDLAGHALSVEWLQPVIHDFNGYQLERDGTLLVRWGYSF